MPTGAYRRGVRAPAVPQVLAGLLVAQLAAAVIGASRLPTPAGGAPSDRAAGVLAPAPTGATAGGSTPAPGAPPEASSPAAPGTAPGPGGTAPSSPGSTVAGVPAGAGTPGSAGATAVPGTAATHEAPTGPAGRTSGARGGRPTPAGVTGAPAAPPPPGSPGAPPTAGGTCPLGDRPATVAAQRDVALGGHLLGTGGTVSGGRYWFLDVDAIPSQPGHLRGLLLSGGTEVATPASARVNTWGAGAGALWSAAADGAVRQLDAGTGQPVMSYDDVTEGLGEPGALVPRGTDAWVLGSSDTGAVAARLDGAGRRVAWTRQLPGDGGLALALDGPDVLALRTDGGGEVLHITRLAGTDGRVLREAALSVPGLTTATPSVIVGGGRLLATLSVQGNGGVEGVLASVPLADLGSVVRTTATQLGGFPAAVLTDRGAPAVVLLGCGGSFLSAVDPATALRSGAPLRLPTDGTRSTGHLDGGSGQTWGLLAGGPDAPTTLLRLADHAR